MELSRDFKEFIQLLNKYNVEYLVVGGYAVAMYGYPRYTGDIDFWVKPSTENSKKVIQALNDFGFAGLGISENDFSEFSGRLKKAKVDFNHILGNESYSEIELEEPEKLQPKIRISEYKPIKNIIDEALSKRLEMAILEKEFGITRARLKKAQWEIFPNLFFTGGVARPSLGTNIWGPYVAAQFELPTFNRKQGEIKQAKAQVEYLEKERERIEHDIKIDVANSLQDLQVREEQVKRFQDKLLVQSEDILGMIKSGYKQGKLSLTDVLNAEQKSRDLKQKYLESLQNYQLALASLEYAVGVPLYGLSEQ